MSEDVIQLKQIKKDWYNQGSDLINVHIYVREVDELEILFHTNCVTLTFYTRNPKFLKEHGAGRRGSKRFVYILNTRYEINEAGSKYNVKQPFIELILKKSILKVWESLEPPQVVGNTKKKTDDKSASPEKKGAKTPPKKGQQLLGGKSTPLTMDGNQDAEVKVEKNLPGSSNASAVDKRNIQKSVSISQVETYAGLTGLENYANNCYMNVVIQLLANIQELRDYFKSDLYIKDINTNNPLCSGGKVVKAFAEVVKVLWSHRKHAFKPSDLKNIMGKRCSLFLGWQQHDAQEFFASLLDNLHEDLNQLQQSEKSFEREKPRVESSSECTDNEKPETAWSSHIKRNNSFIVKLFHGQLMSKVTCDSCRKVSYSYDPCAQISLPIPSCKQTLQVLFYTRDVTSPPMLLKLQISTVNAKMWHLVNMLQTATKVPAHLITLFNGVSDVCTNLQSSLGSILKHKFIIGSEISSKDEADVITVPVFQNLLHNQTFVQCDFCLKSQDDFQGKLKRCTRCMAAAYCTRDCQTKHWSVHSKVCSKELKMQIGLPFFVTLRKDTTYEKLEELLRERAKISTESTDENVSEAEFAACSKPDEQEDGNKSKTSPQPPNLKYVIKTTVKMNVNDETSIEMTADNFSVDAISKSPCLIMEWQNSPEEDKKGSELRSRKMPAHEMFEADCFNATSPSDQYSLYDCLKLFMEPERLDESESWKCPKCTSLQSAKKEMAISSPPWLLLLHLKRFTYGDSGQKIHKSVSYPLNGLDLTPYVARETRNKIEHPLIYDLCGVITHRGNMRMGHYTCMVRLMNQLDQEEIGWRHFDDDCVTKIKNEKVVSPDAYVLMYRVRGAHNAVRLDRFTTLSNSVSTQDNSSVSKRKHADGSSKADRRSASEYTLGLNMKRSIENSNEGNTKNYSDNETFSSPLTTRRCTSALPTDNSTRKKEFSKPNSNLTSTSLPNVATATTTTNQTSTDSMKSSLTGKLEKEGSSGSEESLGSFENLTLNDVTACEEQPRILYTKKDSFEIETIDVSALNENDLD